jgi:hypothetical protein
LGLLTFVVMLVAGCGMAMSANELALHEKANFIQLKLHSANFMETVKKYDPQLKPSSLAESLVFETAQVGSYYFPVGIDPHGTAAAGWLAKMQENRDVQVVLDKPTRPWSLVVSGDDDRNVLRVTGYGESLGRPLFSQKIAVDFARRTAAKPRQTGS